MCVDRWSDLLNTWPQVLQEYGLYPVCSLMWRVSMSLRANVLLQTSHKKALVEELDRLALCFEQTCFIKHSWLLNVSRQILQEQTRFELESDFGFCSGHAEASYPLEPVSDDDDDSGECPLSGTVTDNPSAVEVLLKLLLTDKSSGISWTNIGQGLVRYG